jgi:hypothetical protein
MSSFPKDARKTNGISSWCVSCHMKAVEEHRTKNPTSASSKQEKYRKRKERDELE